MSNAVDFDTAFIIPCGLSNIVDLSPSLTQLRFISLMNAHISANYPN